jgi:hypothetical protein
MQYRTNVLAAFVQGRDSTDDITGSAAVEKNAKADDTDLLFLDAFIGDPLVRSLVQVR